MYFIDFMHFFLLLIAFVLLSAVSDFYGKHLFSLGQCSFSLGKIFFSFYDDYFSFLKLATSLLNKKTQACNDSVVLGVRLRKKN